MILSVSFSTAFKTIGNLCSEEASNNITMDNCSSPINNSSSESPQTEKKIIRNEVKDILANVFHVFYNHSLICRNENF